MPQILSSPLLSIRTVCRAALLLLLLCCLLPLVGCSNSTTSSASGTAESATNGNRGPEPQALLTKVRQAYASAKSYTDSASVVFYAVPRVTGTEREIPFTRSSVAFVRPNKLHVVHTTNIASPQEERYEIASDGVIVRSSAAEIADQIHEAIAPKTISTENFIPEPALRGAILTNSIENTLPQLALLLNENPDQTFFPGASEAQSLADEQLDGQTYHRLQLRGPAGKRVLWIDPQTFAIRRMEMPIENQRKQLNPNNQFSSVAVWIDFEDVSFDAEIDEATFTLAVPDGARRVRRFIPPPPPGPPEQLGKPVSQFLFTSLDGEEVTPGSLKGKVVVLDFWSTNCPPCRAQTPVLNEVYQQFRDNDEVEFLAVSTDSRVVPNDTVANALASWGGEMPIVRDLKSSGYHDLNVRQTPTLLLVDRNGRLQSFQIGAHSRPEPLIEAVQRLVDGENLVAIDREKHSGFVAKYEEALAAAEIKDSIIEVEVVRPEVGARALPERLKLRQLWQTSAEQIARPGAMQILVHEAWGPTARLIALDGGQAIVELNFATGQIIGRHELPEHEERSAGFLRSWSNNEGEPTYLVSGVGWQKVFVLDSSWEHSLSFPDEQHSGIGDVLFDDLTGSGTPVMYVGYWGGLGVQGGTLDGRRLWSNRRLNHVVQLGVGPVASIPNTDDDTSARTVWCTSTRGTLLQLAADGKSIQERYIPGQALMYFASAPDSDNQCGLSVGQAGHYTAVGFNAKNELLWEYPLPPGEYAEPLSRIQSVQLPDGTSVWLVVAANGSLHWLDDDGKLVDRFDYGELLTGVSMNTLGDQTILFVSTPSHLTAWEVTSTPIADEAGQSDANEAVAKPAEVDDQAESAQSEQSAQSNSDEEASN